MNACLRPIEYEKNHVVHVLCVWAPLKHISIKRYVLSLSRLFHEACLVGARLVYYRHWSEPMPQNLGQLCRWALLNYGSCLPPLPFPAPFHHRVVQQTIEKLLFWSLHRRQTCLVKRFRFHAATKPFHAIQQTVHGKHKKVWTIQQYCEVHPPFSGKQDAHITTSMYPL